MWERELPAGTQATGTRAVDATRFALIACGVVTLAVAFAVLAGWHTGTAALAQWRPGFAPMQYNTALGVLLLAAASVLLGIGRGRVATAPAAAAALLGLVSGGQYLTGVDLGIDRWFMDPWLTIATSHPGRMAPNTALTLVLLGATLVLAGMRRPGVWQTLAAGTLAGCAAGLALIALIALFGYATGIESAYGWAYGTGMGVPTALATFLLGASLFAVMLTQSLPERGAFALRLEIPVAVALLVLVVVLSKSLEMQEREEIRRSLASEVRMLRGEATARIDGIVLALTRMAERWAHAGGIQEEAWRADAANYVSDHPSLRSIAWIDEDHVLRWIVPLAGNEAALGLDLEQVPAAREAITRARTQRTPALSRAIDLVQGGKGFVVVVPLFPRGTFDGFIEGVFSFERLFGRLQADSPVSGTYGFAIYDGSERVLVQGAVHEPEMRDWQVEQTLRFGDTPLRMQVWPSPQWLAALDSPLPEATLAGGMVLVALSVFSLYAFHITYRRTLEAERANTTLEREIDRRRQTERDLVAARARLNNILEAAGEGIYGLDTEGRTTFANSSACRMTGWPAEEMIGRAQHAVIHHSRPDGTDYPREECPIYAAFNDGLTYAIDDEVFWRRGGEPFPVEYVSTPLRDEAGNITGAVVVFRDVTERREREEALRRRTAELAAANQELEGFAYSVSHDLRAPLRSMDGFSQALFEDFGDRLDGDARDYLERIRNASRRMERLIDGILAISRVSRAELEYEHVELSALAEETVAALRDLDPDRQVAVDIEPGLVVEGDPRLLRAVLENLVGNAWKFTAGVESARIEVGHEQIGGVTAYYVRDNGTGFDPRYVHKLFHPFQRLHSDSEFEGTGIGLATVARVIHRHGGSVRADGRPGAGATIHFSFEPIGDDA